jgi:hypothetical protein
MPYGRLQFLLNTAISKGDGTFVIAQPQFTPMPWFTMLVWGGYRGAQETYTPKTCQFARWAISTAMDVPTLHA